MSEPNPSVSVSQDGLVNPKLGATSNLSEKTDGQIILAFDNALADYVLANKYECSAHLIPDIRRWMSELSAELQRRNLKYSHEAAMKEANRVR